MRRSGVYVVISVLLLASCKKEEADPVRFYLKATGFEMEAATGDALPDLKHHLAGGVVRFSDRQGVYPFSSKAEGLEHTAFELQPGIYSLEMDVPQASIYGEEGASYQLLTTEVKVSEGTDTLEVQVEANCSMILVNDVRGQLSQGPWVIERHSYADGYFIPYPMHPGPAPGYYYTYLTPDPIWEDPSAFLWFYDKQPGKELGGLTTTQMDAGMVYLIEILE